MGHKGGHWLVHEECIVHTAVCQKAYRDEATSVGVMRCKNNVLRNNNISYFLQQKVMECGTFPGLVICIESLLCKKECIIFVTHCSKIMHYSTTCYKSKVLHYNSNALMK